VKRWFLLLLVGGGCDLVIPLTEPTEAACGPFASIAPVVFDDSLEEPSDFSTHYDGTHGMVRARVKLPANPAMTYTGPVPIVFDESTLAWKLDGPRLLNLSSFRLDGGHLLGDGSVFGWKDRTTNPSAPPSLVRYSLSGMWTADGSGDVLDDPSKNMRPGNEIVLPLENNGFLRFFPQVRLGNDASERNQIVIRQKFVNENWVNTDQADPIANSTSVNPSAAVMTADHGVLVYAASQNGGKQRIFASRRDRTDQYQIGTQLALDADAELDDTEPWIGETCATLYFRRGGITYRAQ
jgi:hypothetical protein